MLEELLNQAVGPTGPTGPSLLRSAYLVTFNDSTKADGIEVKSGDNLPITRTELDISNIITLNNNIIKEYMIRLGIDINTIDAQIKAGIVYVRKKW